MNDKKVVGVMTYCFKDDLLDKPIVVQTVERQNLKDGDNLKYMSIIDSLPVLTFRSGSATRDIKEVYEQYDAAMAGHEKIINEYHLGGK